MQPTADYTWKIVISLPNTVNLFKFNVEATGWSTGEREVGGEKKEREGR